MERTQNNEITIVDYRIDKGLFNLFGFKFFGNLCIGHPKGYSSAGSIKTIGLRIFLFALPIQWLVLFCLSQFSKLLDLRQDRKGNHVCRLCQSVCLYRTSCILSIGIVVERISQLVICLVIANRCITSDPLDHTSFTFSENQKTRF